MSTATVPLPEGTAADPTAPEPTTPPRRRWRGLLRRRWVLALALALVAVLLLVVSGVVLNHLDRRPGDPRSSAGDGTLALRNLITDQGVDVRIARSVASAARAPGEPWTLVVGQGDDLTAEEWQRLLAAGPTDLVLLSPGPTSAGRLGLPVEVSTTTATVAEPGCSDPAAGRAGSTSRATRPVGYAGTGAVQRCYPVTPDAASYLRVASGATTVHLLNAGYANDELLDEGNASFAMQTLGRHAELVWLTAPIPDPDEPAGGSGPAVPSLLPPWWSLLMLQVVVAFFALAVWRGRRLGPIVTEGLPVVVPVGEAVEGHGRLYQRLGARDHAAEVLRRTTLARLTRRLGPTDPLALVEVVNAQTGLSVPWLRQVLLGPPPADDAELSVLHAQLHEIEDRTRRV